jgi:RNA polymerase sigma factor (sigma-70 family)
VHDDGLQAFLQRAADHKVLSADEERELARRVHTGDPVARRELVSFNVRLAVSIAKRFQDRGLPLADLVQAGLVGVDRAARKFDPERGYKFSTYATWWVRKEIQRAIDANGKRAPATVSLDYVHGIDGDESLVSRVADPHAPDPAEALPEDARELRRVLGELTELQRDVVELRFGFRGDSLSISEVAERLKVPASAVTQAQRQALDHLRSQLVPAAV